MFLSEWREFPSAPCMCWVYYRGADRSLARPGRKQANVSVRMAWISFSTLHVLSILQGADKSLGDQEGNKLMFLSEWHEFPWAPCLAGRKTWWQLASRCFWNRTHPWHASELVSFLVGLRTYQQPCTFFWKSLRLWDNVEKYGRNTEATDDNIMWHEKCVMCMLDD